MSKEFLRSKKTNDSEEKINMIKNYSELSEITVKTQDELDMIPLDFEGIIYIEFGTRWNKAIVRNKYIQSVVARENSSVEARENSSVNGSGNAQIVDRLIKGRIEITGNARIVYMPKTIEEYCDFYDIKHDKKKGKFFKCVHKSNGIYYSDNDTDFEYEIGRKIEPDWFDNNPEKDCGHGIHVAYLAWVLDYGRNWRDLAILEVEADLKDIVLPNGCPGKVRCKEVTVLREVPLEECGVYGKILAQRRTEDE